MRNTLLIIIGLLICAILSLNFTSVQNFLVDKATGILADKLKTKVSIEHVRIDFLNHVVIQGLYIEDKAHDTLAYIGEARVRITDWFIFKKNTPVLKYVGLKNTYAHLYRPKTSADWNYQFIIDAFDTGPSTKKKKDSGGSFEIDLEKTELDNVRFHMDDAWVGSDMDFDVGSARIAANEINFKTKKIDLERISFEKVVFVMKDYDGGRPPKPKQPKLNTIDTTAFNTDKWQIALGKLQLEDCYFGLETAERPPYVDEFDTEHMRISRINIDAEKLSITGDTLKAKLKKLSAQERCGLVVKTFKGDITVSPNASIIKNLLLETNRSKLKDYYAMHYTRFPAFNHYIEQVRMVANLQGSHLDSRDIAYFAPVLKQYPTVLQLQGKINGTVADIKAENLFVSDGISVVKGNLQMTGLPDINNTFIDYQNGDLQTTAAGIFRYAPDLKNNKAVNIAALNNISFKGNFTGYIYNFACNGTVATSLGNIRSDVSLKMPDGKTTNALYSGTISTDNFDIGKLLNQSTLGTVSINTKVNGNSFDPALARMKLDATVKHFDLNGYRYQNITMDGQFEKNKFSGNMLIDDPNLAMAFYGSIDLSEKQVRINAKSNVLKSNLAALKLTSDSITANADFDLDCTGSNIDNFTGYAKLYNINMVRNGHRLDLDSVYLRSVPEDDGGKMILIESNALTAKINGRFELSKLPYSFQYYIAGYLPNYIDKPTQEAPPQDISFNIVTKEIDSLLGIIVPNIKGFSGTTIDGKLTTATQNLQFTGNVPYGEMSGIAVHNLRIQSDGDLKSLSTSIKCRNVVIGDSSITGSLYVSGTLANDDLAFTINTASTDQNNTARLSGNLHTNADSVWLKLEPSEIFLNKIKWEIPQAQLLYASNYLFVNDVLLASGTQSIHVYSKNSYSESSVPPVIADIKNIDISQIATLAGAADLQTDGRINGELRVDDIFGDIKLTSNVRATNVTIGADTLGNIVVAGGYNGAKKIVHLDNSSGIYKGNASVTASGDVSLDSNSKEALKGNIQFNNMPLSWCNPLLAGFVSRLSGTLSGGIDVGGSAVRPDINGTLKISDAGMRIDFLGTYYNIPTASIDVNNEVIDFGKITLIDVYKNKATLSGKLTHKRFDQMKLGIYMTSPKFEVINLEEGESELFYGNLIASIKSLAITGPINNVYINILGAKPVEKSHLYLPLNSGDGLGAYNYVSFKSYDTLQTVKKKSNSKLSLSIEAIIKDLCEVSLVMDPATGDAINASGSGTLRIEMPAGNDMRMSGAYIIKEGDYTFTLKQLAFKRNFKLNEGSKIYFNGPIDQTQLDVTGLYRTKARLIDLLSDREKQQLDGNEQDDREAKITQDVDVLLFMKGSMGAPRITFKLDLPNKSSVGTVGYEKLRIINQSDVKLNNQVASLLLVNTFIADEGSLGGGGSAVAGGISNISQMLSGQLSGQLTNIMNKLTGDESLSIDFKYKNYNLNSAADHTNRNEVSFGIKKSLFRNLVNDRLILEVGSSYDWGKPTANRNASNFNPAGDFRLQYQFRDGGNMRGYVFRTNNYDVVDNRSIARGGAGINWHKSFNTFEEFFRGRQYIIRKREEEAKKREADTLNADGQGVSP